MEGGGPRDRRERQERVQRLGQVVQGQGVEVPSQFLSMLPYLATIVVLVAISRNAAWIRVNMPASLGKPFFPGS